MKKVFPGTFVVIEGMDNSGKTTLIELIKNNLSSRACPSIRKHFKEKIVFTSEPYGPQPISLKHKQLSEIIFSNDYEIEAETEALLFLAARKENVSSFIEPELNKGSLVICDRFYLSTLVYQSFLKNVDLKWLLSSIYHIVGNIRPEITFLIEVTEEQHHLSSLSKTIKKKNNKYDSRDYSFQELNNGYLKAVQHLQRKGEKIVIVPFSLSLEEKAKYILEIISTLIE